MQANLKVKRFDPADEGGKTWWQEYKVDVHPDSTVLDSLIQIREQEDGTLALRCDTPLHNTSEGVRCAACITVFSFYFSFWLKKIQNPLKTPSKFSSFGRFGYF